MLEQIKQKFFDDWTNFKAKIEEQDWYLKLQQKWDHLDPKQKKILINGGIVLFIIIIMLPIYNKYENSQINIENFVEKKDLIRNLIITQKELLESDLGIQPVEAEAIKKQIQSTLSQGNLLPEQIESIQVLPSNDAIKSSLSFPPHLIKDVLQINLKQLTIKQLSQIAQKIEQLNPQIKINDIWIKQNLTQMGYLNVELKMLILNYPTTDLNQELIEPNKPPRRGRQ